MREEEAYDQWAIDILVKFRDTEKLQLLTAHRQSGGVRSFLFWTRAYEAEAATGTLADDDPIPDEPDRGGTRAVLARR